VRQPWVFSVNGWFHDFCIICCWRFIVMECTKLIEMMECFITITWDVQKTKWISKTQWLNVMDFYLLGDCNLQRGVTASLQTRLDSVSQWCLHNYLCRMDQTIHRSAPANSEMRWTWYQTIQCKQLIFELSLEVLSNSHSHRWMVGKVLKLSAHDIMWYHSFTRICNDFVLAFFLYITRKKVIYGLDFLLP